MSEMNGALLSRRQSAGKGSNRGQSLSLRHKRPCGGGSVHAAAGEQRPDTLHYLEVEE
jgi:hypothetical protein